MADFTVYDLCAALDRGRIRWELVGTFGTEVQRVMVRDCDFPKRSDKPRYKALDAAVKAWKANPWARVDATDKGDILFSSKADPV